MMKTQLDANVSPSSSRRENYTPKSNLHHQPNKSSKCSTNNNTNCNNTGCMSGIFSLLYKYNNRRRRRFLTSGKNYKQEEDTVSLSPSQEVKRLPRSSCNVPRSPTLPAEIRLSNTSNSSENCKATSTNSTSTSSSTRPSLMGLGLGFEGVHRDLLATAESVAEKRKKLLEALEKCDEDLKALKEIIDVVKRSNTSSNTIGVEEEDNNNSNDNGNKGTELQPSPVSVLDEFMSSPAALQIMNTYSKRYTNGGVMQVQQKQKQKKKPGEEEIITNIGFWDRVITAESIQSRSHHHEKEATSPLWASKAMVESVNEVCKDIAWGEKREIGRIGLALQDRICRDLIEEIVRELECCGLYSLPFEACKRSLRF